MSVTYVIEFKVIDGARGRFLDLLNGVLDTMRHEEEFENAALHLSPDDPHHFLLHETWKNHENVIDVQLKRPYRDAWHAALGAILVGERRVTVWTPLRRDNRD